MTNWHRTAVLQLLKLCDLGVVAAAFVAAVGLTSPGDGSWFALLEMRVKVRNVLFMAGYLGACHVVLHAFRLYRSYRLSPISREWRDVGGAVLVMTLPLWPLIDVLAFDFAGPSFLVRFAVLAFCGIGISRRLLRVLARSIRRQGRNLRNVVIVGNGEQAFDMASRLARRVDLGYRVVEMIDCDGRPIAGAGGNAAVLEHLGALIETQPIDEVFVVLSLDTAQALIRAIVARCEEQGLTIRIVSSIADLILARAQVDAIDGRPVVTLFTGPPDSLSLLAKRVIDLAVSLLAVFVLSPLFLLLAIAIKLDSRGRVLFVQERIGLNGRRFRFYKFRTMIEGADRLQEGLESLNEASGPVFKIRNDPRVTRMGRWIRRLSLDELPQFFNVILGDMSLVGPRPLPLRDVSRFDVRAHKRRFSVKPGITCLWQVSGREPEFDDWIKTDMEYIDNWSLGLDVKILFWTIPAVLSGRGAY